MFRRAVVPLGVVLVLLAGAVVAAQPQGAPQAAKAVASAPIPPGAVVVLYRAEVKPGQRLAQQKAAAATARAYSKLPRASTFLAMTAEYGPSEVWFLVPYLSMADIDAENDSWEKAPPALVAEVEQAGDQEASHYAEARSLLLKYRDDLSLGASFDVSAYRAMAVTTYRIRPGRTEQFVEMGKKVVAAYKQALPDLRFSCFEVAAGGPVGTFMFMRPLKRTVELLPSEASERAFAEAMGKDAMEQLAKGTPDVIASAEDLMFSFSPKMSLLPARYAAADPFWLVSVPAEPPKKAPEPVKK